VARIESGINVKSQFNMMPSTPFYPILYVDSVIHPLNPATVNGVSVKVLIAIMGTIENQVTTLAGF
jgi:hypothetical protein